MPALFKNPDNIVGNYSAGSLTTKTPPHYDESPGMFGNRYIFDGKNQSRGVTCNVTAAEGIYIGGQRRRRRKKKSKSKYMKRKNCGCRSKRRKRGGSNGVGFIGRWPSMGKGSFPTTSGRAIPQAYLPGMQIGNGPITVPPLGKNNIPLSTSQKGGYTYNSEMGGNVSIKSTKKRRKGRKTRKGRKRKKRGGTGFRLDASGINRNTSALASPMPHARYNTCKN